MAGIRLAVSNLAWAPEDEAALLPRLAGLGVAGVEVAPRVLAPWGELTPTVLRDYHRRLAAEGLVVSSLQAVYFDRPGVALLEDTASFARMREHTRCVGGIAAELGARPIVFGAPRQRRRGPLDEKAATDLAAERLALLGEDVATAGACLAIEPVPEIYGGDFLLTASEAIALVRRIGHPAVKVHLDTGCITLGGGDIARAVYDAMPDLVHMHFAEPELGDFAAPRMPHAAAASALVATGYRGWVAIEMKRPEDGGENRARDAVEQAARFAGAVLATVDAKAAGIA